MRIETKTLRLFRNIAKMVAPPKQLNMSEWADQYRRLSTEASAEPGQWRTDRAPYLREIMNTVNDAFIETIIIQASSQVGKTELLLNTIGYFIDYDPAPIMLIQPTLELAEAFSKDRLAPMLRDTPALKGKVRDVKSRDSGNTLLHKAFPGGHITMVGANSPANLASRPIRILLADEVDRYPTSAGTEGDPLTLAEKRTTTFWNKKKIYVSTPTIKGTSRIEMAYEQSTQEQWCLPCPNCDEYQPLEWSRIHFEDATMECLYCGFRHDEYTWKARQLEGKWVAQSTNEKVRGFHLNELASPWSRWTTIIENFKKANEKAKQGNIELLKSWVNTTLGESWEEKGETVEADTLPARRERYDVDVPDGVLLLTAGVDVQDDRFEIEIVGWGEGKETWGIEYKVIPGDLKRPEIWRQLDEYLTQTWENPDGVKLNIAAACMDSGGHFTMEVYDFCKAREHRRIFAIKGRGEDNVPYIGNPSRNNRKKAALFPIGVSIGKERIFSFLKVQDPGPGYCHFPLDSEKGYDEAYFKGLTAEERKKRFVKGQAKYEWVKKYARNEPLDCRNYAMAAMEIVNPNFDVLRSAISKGSQSSQVGAAQRKRRVISKGL